jgi:hypothetical protein
MSKRTIALIIVFVILALLLLFLKNSRKGFSTSLTEKESEKLGDLTVLDVQNWHEFTSENPPFKVMLPTLPQHAADTKHNEKDNENRKYDMFVSQKSNGAVFAITAIQFDTKKNLGENRTLSNEILQQLVAAKPDNVLIKKTDVEWNGMKAIDFQIKQNDVLLAGRIFVQGNRLYVLTITTEKANYNPREFEFFTNSFDLIELDKQERTHD